MSSPRWVRLILRRRLRPVFLVGIGALILVQIVALSPSSVEDSAPSPNAAIDPSTLTTEGEAVLATGIPKNRIPEYSVDGFNYVSTKGLEKQWKLMANRAHLYNDEKLVHTRIVKALIFDAEGKTTTVTGLESKYYMNAKARDIEIYGNVKTVLPDGFEIYSQYLHYKPDTREIDIPIQYPVEGGGQEQDGQRIHFKSMGMSFPMNDAKITLPQAVHFTMARAAGPQGGSAPEVTNIDSDHCLIDRKKQIAYFTMYPKRPLTTRFVHITQEKLFARSRRANLNYGDFSKLLQYIYAEEDVLIKETGGEALKYSTSGKADFDTRSDVIILTEFPQVYQDNDTVTGDLIKVHRESDIIEVEQSNAYTQGN